MKELIKPLMGEEKYPEDVVDAMCTEHTGNCCIWSNDSQDSDVEEDILF